MFHLWQFWTPQQFWLLMNEVIFSALVCIMLLIHQLISVMMFLDILEIYCHSINALYIFM